MTKLLILLVLCIISDGCKRAPTETEVNGFNSSELYTPTDSLSRLYQGQWKWESCSIGNRTIHQLPVDTVLPILTLGPFATLDEGGKRIWASSYTITKGECSYPYCDWIHFKVRPPDMFPYLPKDSRIEWGFGILAFRGWATEDRESLYYPVDPNKK